VNENVTTIRLWIKERNAILAPGSVIMAGLFAITTLFFMIGDAERGVIALWAIVTYFGLALYNYSFHKLLPAALTKRYSFFQFCWKALITIVICSFVVVLATFLITLDADEVFNTSVLNAFLQMVITVPISWFVYKRYRVGKEELSSLKKELRQSTASVDFLRSQINPHFLFNVLNTLYGTALQEKADRTSEGIQRLGDMMRFMLHENLMERIPLAREIEYLNDYITLQKLRTDTTATIDIEIDIPSEVPSLSISPMLLIPFVENAFKHGISFREPSYIRVVMTIKHGTLYFDVTNSAHPKQENDPEKNSNGIGLANVRQRLALNYPKKHDLITKESGKDFFVHLTIQLK